MLVQTHPYAHFVTQVKQLQTPMNSTNASVPMELPSQLRVYVMELAPHVISVTQIVVNVRLELLINLNTLVHRVTIRIRNLGQFLEIQADNSVNVKMASFSVMTINVKIVQSMDVHNVMLMELV
jgi:hypothetical protein